MPGSCTASTGCADRVRPPAARPSTGRRRLARAICNVLRSVAVDAPLERVDQHQLVADEGPERRRRGRAGRADERRRPAAPALSARRQRSRPRLVVRAGYLVQEAAQRRAGVEAGRPRRSAARSARPPAACCRRAGRWRTACVIISAGPRTSTRRRSAPGRSRRAG